MYPRVAVETSEDPIAGSGRCRSRLPRHHQAALAKPSDLPTFRAGGSKSERDSWPDVVHVTDSNGAVAPDIALMDKASKGRSGRTIPISKELRAAFDTWKADCRARDPKDHVISTERSEATSSQVLVNLFRAWYGRLGFQGCSSHSGRRTLITNAARRISTVGGSLRDVQALAGHATLGTTQRYIEINPEAKRKIVELVGS